EEARTERQLVAGAASHAAARLCVRRELTAESVRPRRTAAGVPSRIAPRKMKASPAVTQVFVPGRRTRRKVERTTKLASARSCSPCEGESERQRAAAQTSAAAPDKTSASQQARA